MAENECICATPPVEVQDPAPQTPRYGLLSVATPLDLPNAHSVTGGVTYKTVTTDLPDGYEVLCEGSRMTMVDPCGDWIVGTPFIVQANLIQGAIGIDASQEQIRASLLARLFAGEQPIVESVFSDGLFGQSPSLANNNPVAATLAASVSLIEAFGRLEDWLYSRQGPRGVLHIPLSLAARCEYLNLMAMDSDRVWRTALGTSVVFGNYSGHDSGGHDPAAGTTNLYITGSTTVWREPDSQVFVTPYRGNIHMTNASPVNQVSAFARRAYVVTHNGLLAATATTIYGCECEPPT